MEELELLKLLSLGEDSRRQFKKNIHNIDSLAAEMVAFSNSSGGQIFIGISDDGSIDEGLSREDINRLNKMLSNAASQKVIPPINPENQVITINDKLVMVVNIQEGINKPYQDSSSHFWVKSGADKRKLTAKEELQRIFQSSNLIHADEILAKGLSTADLDMEYFQQFFQKRYGESLYEAESGVAKCGETHFRYSTDALNKLLSNLNLAKDGQLNLAAALLFTKNPSNYLPAFIVKAAAFPSLELTTETYLDSRDITGKLSDIFQQTLSFILINIHHIQGDQGINSIGIPEIPRIVLEELIANALIHRDYFISAPVRVFIFLDRVEIISPGHLPNNLTVENIKAGNSNIRNPVLASFANHILPYRGFGSGILRALQNHPHIDFEDDRAANLFKAIIYRPSYESVSC